MVGKRILKSCGWVGGEGGGGVSGKKKGGGGCGRLL